MTTESILFVKGSRPLTVEGGPGNQYQAGQLSAAGLRSQAGTLRQIKHYLKSAWGYSTDNSPEQNDNLPAEAMAVANLLYEDSAFSVLMADYSRQLGPADLVQWDDDYLEKCYAAVLELNPKLNPANILKAAEVGQAQPETHDTETGEPVSIEAARKKA